MSATQNMFCLRLTIHAWYWLHTCICLFGFYLERIQWPQANLLISFPVKSHKFVYNWCSNIYIMSPNEDKSTLVQEMGLDIGLLPYKVVIWTNAWFLLIGSLGTYFSEIVLKQLSSKKMQSKVLYAQRQPFHTVLNIIMLKIWRIKATLC